jgi:lipopolysaccharide export system permease protein
VFTLRLRIPRPAILDRYVVREVFAPFAVGVGLLTFALVTGRMVKLTEMVINRGVSLKDVALLIAYVLGVLLGFGRMSSDQEMTAARACGVSLYRLAAPVIVFAIVVYLIASWFAFSIRPWANSQLHDRIYTMGRATITAGIRDKAFNDDIPGIIIYVDHVSNNDETLHGVMISDSRGKQQNTIIARRGIILPDDQRGGTTLRLFNGSVFGGEPGTDSSHVTSFHIYDLSIQPKGSLATLERDPEELSYSALKQDIAQARAEGKPDYEAEAELAAKYTVPFATLLFAIIGIPLGLKPARGGHSERFGVAVALFFAYYALMKIGRTLAEHGKLNAFIALSIPDVVFAALAIWLFVRAASDRGNQGRGPGDMLWDLVERIERSRKAA